MGKKVKRKFNFKKFIIFIIIVFVIVLFSYYLLSQNIRNIIILNNNYYNDEVIIETSGIEDYPLFVSLSKKEVKNKLMKLDLVDDGITGKEDRKDEFYVGKESGYGICKRNCCIPGGNVSCRELHGWLWFVETARESAGLDCV